jgi:hypothetical protein
VPYVPCTSGESAPCVDAVHGRHSNEYRFYVCCVQSKTCVVSGDICVVRKTCVVPTLINVVPLAVGAARLKMKLWQGQPEPYP